MPTIKAADGCRIHVEIEGPERAPALMLSNSLGTDLAMWDPQVQAFSRNFRLVRYDRRGHGRSDAPKGPYTMEQLGRDALAIMDALGLAKVNWCGLSMGGMVGQWLGANAPERIDRLVLSNTSCYYPVKAPWDERIAAVRKGGVEAVADAGLGRWFSPDFRERAPDVMAHMRAMMVATPVEGYVGCCEAVRDMDHREILARIKAPTLVIAGRYDLATPIEAAEYIRSRIPGAALTVIEAAHISNVEQPAAYTSEVLGFLTQK
ncbi:MAG TPA: 3-oxoadipate enol-lactonase [Xanthobacteraceae bacterium]|nr:3-oxoadipate enol-lactonase [Xanthobacteraceae bacterium]